MINRARPRVVEFTHFNTLREKTAVWGLVRVAPAPERGREMYLTLTTEQLRMMLAEREAMEAYEKRNGGSHAKG